MLPSIPIPRAQGKSSLAPYKQNMKKSWTSNSRWAQEAEGRVDHKSKFRLQPRSQSVPLSRAYGGMQAQMQQLRQQGGSAMGYGTDDFEEDLDNSTVSHLSHKHDMRAQQRIHEQHIKQSHGQASRLTDYDKKLFSQQTLNEMPWARQQPGRVGIAARMSDKEMERAERRAEMAERKAARKLQHQHEHQKQQHEMQARGGRSNKPPRNMMVGGHTPEERPWGGLLKKPPRRSLNSEWDAASPNASGMQEMPWDRRAPAGGRGFLGSQGGMGGSAGGGAYMGQGMASQASSGGEDISRRSSAVDMLRLNTGSTAGGGSLQSSPSRSPMGKVRRGSLGRAPLDPPPPQRPPMWRVNNNGHGANMAAGYASPSVYSAAPSANVSRHATPRQAARGAGGGSRVGTVGGEDELMEGEARRRLVVEWIVKEFDEIAASNRFHMKQLYQYLSDRNVSFDKAQVKVLVTEVYRRVFILSGWIASTPITPGGQVTRALIPQATRVLVAGGVQVAPGPEEEAVVADCLRLLMGRSVQQQAQSGEDENEEEVEEEKEEDAIQRQPVRGGGMGRGAAAADVRDKGRRRATEEEARGVGRGKVSRMESSERVGGGRSLEAKGGKVASGRAESKQVSGPKDRAAAAKKVDKAPHAAKAKAGSTKQKTEKPVLGAGIRGDGGLESYMAPPGKAENALLQEHMRLMSSLKGAGSTVASSRGTARRWEEEEEEEEEGEVDQGYDPHLGFDEAALGIDLRGGALAAARSSPIEHKIGTHRSSINLDSINAPSPIGSQNWLPPPQRGVMGGRGDMPGRDVAAGIDTSQDIDQMSDLGSGDDEGPAPLDGRYRIYVHANCGESSDTEPVMVYEGPMLGPANDTIALACFDENGTRAHNLVTHQKNGLMHAKSHKGPLTVPLDACQPLRLLDSSPTRRSMGVTLPEGQPIKTFIEAGTSDGQWVDTGAWDGILGVREHSFISPSRITKGQGSFSVMWGLAIEPEHQRHKLVYLCIKSRA